MPLQDQRYVELVTRLRRARISARLTQDALGARLGKPQSFVSKYESCERRLDPIELIDICSALGIPPEATLAGLSASPATVDGDAADIDPHRE